MVAVVGGVKEERVSFFHFLELNRQQKMKKKWGGGRLTGKLRQVPVERQLVVQDLVGLDLDVRGLALRASEGLVDHDSGVGQRVAFPLRSRGQEEGPHGGGQADADGGDVGADEAHGVEDGHARGDGASGAVDVHGDVGLKRVFFFFEKDELFEVERPFFFLSLLGGSLSLSPV